MGLYEFAKHELDLIGMREEGDPWDVAARQDILNIVNIFANSGHSGASAECAVEILVDLLSYRPLSPLTGEDSEWQDISDISEDPIFQNKRCPSVFMGVDGVPYDVNGKVFIDPDGSAYSSHESKVVITFPYTPRTEYVHRTLTTTD